MPHTLLLGPQVKQIVFRRAHLDRHTLFDGHAKLRKLVYFIRIVGEQAHALYSKIPQDLCTDVIFPLIPGKTKCQISLQGIHALFLQFIGLQLVDQTDAASFLPHVKENTTSFFFNLGHGCRKLLATVTAQGTKRIAGQTFRMNPAKDIFPISNLTFYQCDMMFAI